MANRSLYERWLFLAVLCTGTGIPFLAGCAEETESQDHVARVEDRYLFEEDIERTMGNIPMTGDLSETRRHIIDQWLATEVLYQEALRRGLAENAEVQRRLDESERSVLVNAFIESFYRENSPSPSAEETLTYFEQHKEQLRLREPFVRLRYLRAGTFEEATQAQLALRNAPVAERDSVWSLWANTLETSPSASDTLFTPPISAYDHYPESRLFGTRPLLRQALAGLSDERTAAVVESDSAYHVLQLAQRIPTGTIPEQEWIQPELERQLILQNRKQLYARLVQRLRNEALAREALDSP